MMRHFNHHCRRWTRFLMATAVIANVVIPAFNADESTEQRRLGQQSRHNHNNNINNIDHHNNLNDDNNNNNSNRDDLDIDIDITVIGDPIDIWSSVDTWHKCNILDVPDIPTRAYKQEHNTSLTNTIIHMVQGSTNYHIMTGSSLFNITRQCRMAWNMTGNPHPDMFAANEFLDSTHAFPNGTVVALSHTEYPGDGYDNCNATKGYPYCWIVTLGLMISYDWGSTWQHARPPPHHLVATVPYVYNNSQQQLACGWGDPTNILQHPNDGYYYVAMWNRNQVGAQAPGMCLMRTQSLLDPTSWRGWNGHDFVVSLFVSPYHHHPSFQPEDHVCEVLDIQLLDRTQCNGFGLVYSPSLNLFIMTLACLSGNDPIYYATSKDLIHWTTPQPLYDKTMLPPHVRHNVSSMHYPNLMDATVHDPNYSIIGSTPHLFWVSIGHGIHTDGRHAWATPIHIQRKHNTSAAAFVFSSLGNNQVAEEEQ